ncbi:peptidyl-prolyl cis-trans isomerase CYP18-1-like [Miscanthus floridulus]|uniref:peptidyl-prolyl cis-trans isomerase CYP18-1-like n=1 Tax=Miscanthus floridulus TaxID=154761 RepID=UPI00345A2DE6
MVPHLQSNNTATPCSALSSIAIGQCGGINHEEHAPPACPPSRCGAAQRWPGSFCDWSARGSPLLEQPAFDALTSRRLDWDSGKQRNSSRPIHSVTQQPMSPTRPTSPSSRLHQIRRLLRPEHSTNHNFTRRPASPARRLPLTGLLRASSHAPRGAMSVTLHTNLGDIKCEVFCDQVPRTAENFLALCASGYYDGTVFHRNIKGFMIQGGDPTGTGKGGTSIWGTKFADEFRESLKHNARGFMSMANSGPNTNGSQFFIAYAKQPHLNGHYTVFAKVIHGFEVLDLMEKAQTGPGDRPLAEIRLNRVTIHANPLAL